MKEQAADVVMEAPAPELVTESGSEQPAPRKPTPVKIAPKRAKKPDTIGSKPAVEVAPKKGRGRPKKAA